MTLNAKYIVLLCASLLMAWMIVYGTVSTPWSFPETIQQREWERPDTSDAPQWTNIAHQQLTQNAPSDLQERLRTAMQALPWVAVTWSWISVSGARALQTLWTQWPTLAWDERVHLHPEYDGSLHLAVDQPLAQRLVDAWRAEYHPRNWWAVMIYWPRDDDELQFVIDLLEYVHKNAHKNVQ